MESPKNFWLGLGVLSLQWSLWGCSTVGNKLDSWWDLMQGESREARKEFSIRKVWVKPTLSQDNEGLRRINRMSPLVFGSLIIQGNSSDGISAYRSETGERVWTYSLDQGVEASGVLFKNRVYIAATDGAVVALKADTGELLWSSSTKSENTATPLFDSGAGALYVLSGNNGVHSFDGLTGKTNWIFTRQDTSSLSIRGGTRPLLVGDLLYVGFSEGSFVALNSKSGTVAWEIALNKNKRFRDVEAGAVWDKDRLYVSGFDDKLYALSPKGEIIWRFEEGGYSPVKIEGDRIYYPTTTGKVYCLSRDGGQPIWSYSVKAGLATEVQLYKGLVVFGESQGSLVFLNARNGTEVTAFEPGRGVMSSPNFDPVHSRVYFISGEANLYALEAQWQKRLDLGYLR